MKFEFTDILRLVSSPEFWVPEAKTFPLNKTVDSMKSTCPKMRAFVEDAIDFGDVPGEDEAHLSFRDDVI